jgi:hypothetical protein
LALKTCLKCFREFNGSNSSKYCKKCSLIVAKEKAKFRAQKYRKRKLKKKHEPLKPIVKPKEFTPEEQLHKQVQEKLGGKGDYWSMISHKSDFSIAEISHISRCDRCSLLWKKRGGGFNDLPQSPWHSEKQNYPTDSEQLKDIMKSEGFKDYL